MSSGEGAKVEKSKTDVVVVSDEARPPGRRGARGGRGKQGGSRVLVEASFRPSVYKAEDANTVERLTNLII